MRTLKTPLVFFILLSNLAIFGQGANFVWAQRFGGNSNDDCSSACDIAGNVYRMQEGIAKHNSAGVQQWSVTTAYSPFRISFDAAGDLYITGSFTGTADLDHGAGTFTVTSVGLADIAVVKLSGSTGNFIWGGSMGSVLNDNYAFIFTDAAGSSYIGSTFGSVFDVDPGTAILNFTPTSNSDFFVSKLDATGSLQWAKHFKGTTSGDVASFNTDAAGNVYFCGSFYGTVDFDPGATVNNLSSNGSSDIYVCKLDGSGNFGWVIQIGGTGTDYARYIQLGSNGSLYCAGTFAGTVDFDPGPGTLVLNSGAQSNVFVAEFSTSGALNRAKQLSGPVLKSMRLDSNNDILLAGTFNTANFDPGPGTFTVAANGGGSTSDIFVSKLSSTGNFLWVKTFGNTNDDFLNSMSIDGADNIYMAGRFNTTCDFDPNNDYYPLTAAGGNLNYDAFMLKLCQTPNQLASIIGSTILCNGYSETYSVSAVPGVQLYTWTLPSGWTSGSTTNSILALPTSGTGTVSVTISNSCGDSYASSISVNVSECTGLNPVTVPAQLSMHVYPNPSVGLFTVELTSAARIIITDVSGKTICTQKLQAGVNVIDLKIYDAGIYFLNVAGDGWKENMRLVRE